MIERAQLLWPLDDVRSFHDVDEGIGLESLVEHPVPSAEIAADSLRQRVLGNGVVASEEENFSVGVDRANVGDHSGDAAAENSLGVRVPFADGLRARFGILKNIIGPDRKQDCVGAIQIGADIVVLETALDI